MIVLALVAAIALTSAPTRLPGFSVGEEDYPPFARRYVHEGVVGFNVEVDAVGTPQTCTVSLSSTFAELDAKTCEIVEKRMRFAPAQNESRQPIVGYYSGRIRWKLDGTVPSPFIDGMRIEHFSFSSDGSTASCTVETRGGLAPAASPRCDAQWATALPGILKAPLNQITTATIVTTVRAGDNPGDNETNDFGPRRFNGTVEFLVTAAGRAEQCTTTRSSVMAQLTDVCALIFAGQTEERPAFGPGVAQRGSVSLSIYARQRPQASLKPAELPRP